MAWIRPPFKQQDYNQAVGRLKKMMRSGECVELTLVPQQGTASFLEIMSRTLFRVYCGEDNITWIIACIVLCTENSRFHGYNASVSAIEFRKYFPEPRGVRDLIVGYIHSRLVDALDMDCLNESYKTFHMRWL